MLSQLEICRKRKIKMKRNTRDSPNYSIVLFIVHIHISGRQAKKFSHINLKHVNLYAVNVSKCVMYSCRTLCTFWCSNLSCLCDEESRRVIVAKRRESDVSILRARKRQPLNAVHAVRSCNIENEQE